MNPKEQKMAYGRQSYGYKPQRFGYVRSGPPAGGAYYQTVGAQQSRDRLGAPQAAGLERSRGLNRMYGGGPYAPRPARPPAAAPAQPPAPQGGAPPDRQPAAAGYDYTGDPILQKIRALSNLQRGDARSEATKLRKQVAVDYGDEGYARNTLGDEQTALAAAQNPFSVLGELRRGYDTGSRDLIDALNDGRLGQNLLFSGERIKQEGELARDYQGRLAGAQGEFQGVLGGIDRGLLDALLAADERDLLAEQEAARAARERAVVSGTDPGGGLPPATPPLLPPGGGGTGGAGAGLLRPGVPGFGGPTDPNDPLLLDLLAGRATGGGAASPSPLAQADINPQAELAALLAPRRAKRDPLLEALLGY